jgi:hypothetical protein
MPIIKNENCFHFLEAQAFCAKFALSNNHPQIVSYGETL